jgi:hypothetical protein
LPSPLINNVVVSLAFSHLSLFSVASLSSLPSASTMGKNNKRKCEPTPPSEEFGDSEYSEEEFSSESEGSLAPIPLPRGLRRRSGRTSGPSSAPGSRARMSRSTPRMRRTRTAAARTTTTTTTMTAAAAARTVTTAAAGAATGAAAAGAAPAAAAAAAATGPVARCHWSFRY